MATVADLFSQIKADLQNPLAGTWLDPDLDVETAALRLQPLAVTRPVAPEVERSVSYQAPAPSFEQQAQQALIEQGPRGVSGYASDASTLYSQQQPLAPELGIMPGDSVGLGDPRLGEFANRGRGQDGGGGGILGDIVGAVSSVPVPNPIDAALFPVTEPVRQLGGPDVRPSELAVRGIESLTGEKPPTTVGDLLALEERRRQAVTGGVTELTGMPELGYAAGLGTSPYAAAFPEFTAASIAGGLIGPEVGPEVGLGAGASRMIGETAFGILGPGLVRGGARAGTAALQQRRTNTLLDRLASSQNEDELLARLRALTPDDQLALSLELGKVDKNLMQTLGKRVTDSLQGDRAVLHDLQADFYRTNAVLKNRAGALSKAMDTLTGKGPAAGLRSETGENLGRAKTPPPTRRRELGQQEVKVLSKEEQSLFTQSRRAVQTKAAKTGKAPKTTDTESLTLEEALTGKVDDVQKVIDNAAKKGLIKKAAGGGKRPPRDPTGLRRMFDSYETPDDVRVIVNDFIEQRAGLIKKMQSLGEMSRAGRARRAVSSAVSGAQRDPRIDELGRLEEDLTNILLTGQTAQAFRAGRAVDTQGLLFEARDISQKVTRQILRDVYGKNTAALRNAEKAVGAIATERAAQAGPTAQRIIEAQQALKELNLTLDLSIFGQQVEAALRRGNVPLALGTLNRTAESIGAKVGKPTFIDIYGQAHPNRQAFWSVRGLEISGKGIERDARELVRATAGSRVGRAAEIARREVPDALMEFQYGKILAGVRLRAAEGLAIQAKVVNNILKRVPGLKGVAKQFDINDPMVARKISEQANMIGSAARRAGAPRRAAIERFTLLTPSMTRAQANEMARLFDVTTPIGLMNSVNTVGSYAVYFGALKGLHDAVGGVNQFTLDPQSYDFGKIVLPDGRTMDFMPQASIYKAARRSLNRGDPEGIAKAWTEFSYGRLNMLPQMLPTIAGIGYAKEGGVQEQVFPSGEQALEFGWFGDNEWDDALTWQQRAGSLIPFPLAPGQMIGDIVRADSIGEAFADGMIAALGQQEYEESSFGATERISQTLYESKYRDLNTPQQLAVIAQAREEGRPLERDQVLAPWWTAGYDDTWRIVQQAAENEGAGSMLKRAATFDDLEGFVLSIKLEAQRRGLGYEETQDVVKEAEKRLNNELSQQNKIGDMDEIARAIRTKVIQQDPTIYDAVVSYYQEKGFTVPKWLREVWAEATDLPIAAGQ